MIDRTATLPRASALGAHASERGPAMAAQSVVAAATESPVYSGMFLCALAYVFVDYGRPQNWLPVLAFIKPGMLASLAGMAALIARGLPKDRGSKYVLAFWALMVFLVPLAFNRNRAFFGTWGFTLLVFGGVLPIALLVDSFKRLQVLARLWVAVHVSLALYTMTNAGRGIGSFLIDENDVALAFNMAVPYAAALIILERGILRRMLAAGATLIMLIAITGTMSRGGFIGIACVLLVGWAQSRRKVVSLIALIAILGVILVATPQKYWDEMSTITTSHQKGDTGAQRMYSWKLGWYLFLDNPILGVGPFNYPFRAHEYETSEGDGVGFHIYGRVAHSLYFTLLPEVGTVGTLIFAGMVIHGVRGRWRLRRTLHARMAAEGASPPDRERDFWLITMSTAIDAALVGFLITGAFLSVLYYPHIWILTAFSSALVGVAERTTTTAVHTVSPEPVQPVAFSHRLAEPRIAALPTPSGKSVFFD
jgi:probable O-glycosylation ligase (exosortase A-associated)